MFEFVEKVVYINLEHRTDRRAEIEHVLSAIPTEKILRFNAIKHEHGGIGASMSHKAVIELAIENKWKNVLVIEDDAVWSANAEKSYQLLLKLIQNPYDVLVLGSVYPKYDSNYKVSSVQSGTAYIVQEHYYPVLLENLKEGLQGFLETRNYPVYALDQYWKRIQPRDNWYCVIPSLMIQRPGYSDIEKTMLNNGQYFS
jgi:hypothetical protein